MVGYGKVDNFGVTKVRSTAKTRESAVRIYSIFSDRSSLVAKTGNVTRMGHMWVADGMMRKVLRLGTIQPLHTTIVRLYDVRAMYSFIDTGLR